MEREIGDDSSDEGEAFKPDGVMSTYTRRDPSDLRETICLAWVAEGEEEGDDDAEDAFDAPPMYIILYRELLEKGWGWKRLVPYTPDYVQWNEYKKYLEEYFSHNAGQVATLCAQRKSKPIRQGVPDDYNVLHDAANLCITTENKFVKRCCPALTSEDLKLSRQIKERAGHMIQSEGESSVAAAGLVCIMMEAQLMCKSLKCDFETTRMVSFGNKVRQSAFNLMLYKGTGSDAASAAAAMVGMAKEAKKATEDFPKEVRYSVCETIRACTANALTMLEKEFACNTAGNADENGIPTSDKSEKPMGISTIIHLNCEECDLMSKNEHQVKDNSLKGKKNKNLNMKRKLKKKEKKEQKKLKSEKRKLKNGNDTKVEARTKAELLPPVI